jgi:hypothetical protein
MTRNGDSDPDDALSEGLGSPTARDNVSGAGGPAPAGRTSPTFITVGAAEGALAGLGREGGGATVTPAAPLPDAANQLNGFIMLVALLLVLPPTRVGASGCAAPVPACGGSSPGYASPRSQGICGTCGIDCGTRGGSARPVGSRGAGRSGRPIRCDGDDGNDDDDGNDGADAGAGATQFCKGGSGGAGPCPNEAAK